MSIDEEILKIAHEMHDAMQEFCNRVDAQEVRSVRTYAKFNDILAKYRSLHDNKFKQFHEACKNSSAKTIVVASLDVLGDNIAEINNNVKYACSMGKIIEVVSIGIIIRGDL